MKVISLWQPWATLAVTGHKRIETRGWDTKYRGPLLIHAAKKWDIDTLQAIEGTQFMKQVLQRLGYWWGNRKTNLPLGAIVGVVNLKDTHKTDNHKAPYDDEKSEIICPEPVGDSYLAVTAKELAFGDYSPGRYGWLLSDAVAFKTPIPAKGMQGFWNYDGPLPEMPTDFLTK